MTLPTLYCEDKNRKERYWKIHFKGDTVYKEYGVEDTVKPVKSQRTYEGMGRGKSKTTAEEQARREAVRDWVKQLDKRYKPRKTDKKGWEMYTQAINAKRESGGNNREASDTLLGIKKEPKASAKKETKRKSSKTKIYSMLAPVEYWSSEKRCLKHFDLKKGVYCQPKADGNRASLLLEGDEVLILSRNSKEFRCLDHIRKAVKKILKKYKNVVLDVELYCQHAEVEGRVLKKEEMFSFISSCCKTSLKEPNPDEHFIKGYVFDIVDLTGEMNQDQRFRLLNEIFEGYEGDELLLLDTRMVHSEKEIYSLHDEFVADGFEGVMIRDRKLMYEQKHRALKLRKLKVFVDEECPIVGVHLNTGVKDHNFVWVCEYRCVDKKKCKKWTKGKCGCKNGKMFHATPEGTHKMKSQWYKDCQLYLGASLTVKYQELTSTDEEGVPRFPVGRFRDKDDM